MNNCRKFIDKAPLVKRLSNSLLRCGDEYRPLLNDNSSFSSTSNYLSASTAQIASKLDNITDADANELIASKFGDSCRKSLTSVLLDNRPKKDYCEFDFKQNWMRETSSGRQIALMFSIIISLMYVYKVYIQIAIIKRTKTKKKNSNAIKLTILNDFICFFLVFFCFIFAISVHIKANSSPKMFAFSTKQKRIRGLSIMEQTELKDAPWFQIGVPREISLEVLRRKNIGEFLVRESSTKPGCFALSLRAPPPAPKVVHYLILRTPRGYKIKVSYHPNRQSHSQPINSHFLVTNDDNLM